MATKPSQAQIDRVKRQNIRTHKGAGVALSKESRSPKDTAKLNATLKAQRIGREMAAKKRGVSAVSGLKKAPTRSDNERSRTQGSIKASRRAVADKDYKGLEWLKPSRSGDDWM
jgi:hypothetical protein